MAGLSRESKDESFGVEYFEQLYEQPDPWDYSGSMWELHRLRSVLNMISENRYARALDFGCGEGHFTRRLKSICNQVVAIDLSPTAIARAEAQGGSGIDYRVGDQALLGDRRLGSFDLIVCMDVLDYLPELADVREVLARFHKLLRAQGTLLITVAYRRTAKAAHEAKYRWDKCSREEWLELLPPEFRVRHHEVIDSRIRQWVVIRKPGLVRAFDVGPVEMGLRYLSRRMPDSFGSTLAVVADRSG